MAEENTALRYLRTGWIVTSPLFVVSVLFVVNTVNPMAFAFMNSIEIVNRSGETIHITPVGRHIETGTRHVLRQYGLEMPAIPAFRQGNFLLEPGERRKIVYDSDDVRPSEILVATAGGVYREVPVGRVDQGATEIQSVQRLPEAGKAVLDAALGSEFNWIEWILLLFGSLPLLLYIKWRRLHRDLLKPRSEHGNGHRE